MNPILLSFGPIQIHWYSFFIALGLLIGGYMVLKESKKHGILEDNMIDFFFVLLPISFVGARLYFVVFHLDYYLTYPIDIIKVWEGGLAIHGGIIAGGLYLLYFTRKNNYSPLFFCDTIVISLILGQAIGRWGNFMNGEAYGPVTTLSFLKSLHLPQFIIDGMKINGVYHQPTFLYESLWCLLGFIIMLCLKNLKSLKLGTLTSFYLIWYGIERLFVEQLRTDSLMLGPFKIAQIVSFVFILIGLSLIIYIRKNPKQYREEIYEK